MQGLKLCDLFVRFQGKFEAPCTSHDSDKKEAWTPKEPYKEVALGTGWGEGFPGWSGVKLGQLGGSMRIKLL